MRLNEYPFRPSSKPVLTKWVVDEVLEAREAGLTEAYVSLDMGLSKERVLIKGDFVVIRGIEVKLSSLMNVKNEYVYLVDEKGLSRISFFKDGKYYKLRAVNGYTAPTLEISGVHMHRVKDVTPWIDSKMKVRALGASRGDVILDTCTGLGYTAINCVNYGAWRVYTVEVDLNVLKIAELNPWSKGLSNERIKVIHGDVTKVIHEFSDCFFNKVLHDPPRFSMAGELYSSSFYEEVYRVLKPGGRMFHYTGYPGEKYRGKSLRSGVADRLKKAGFLVEWREKVQGFVAIKPR